MKISKSHWGTEPSLKVETGEALIEIRGNHKGELATLISKKLHLYKEDTTFKVNDSSPENWDTALETTNPHVVYETMSEVFFVKTNKEKTYCRVEGLNHHIYAQKIAKLLH